ncbi:MAG: hypothetical protein CME63_03340 [Halobacteriovoraceae bacterium]|jgi:glutathione synthase|nr:hypothetical protein [Halobacteriovoraceae bacterium]|tara:strand:- start:46216 stop:47205 length:990 start_codon:yes stop_codon:yes gene_type:complete
MKKHILFIDPLDKLVPKKDSSLQLALTLKEMGKEVYLLFEKDFYFANHKNPEFDCYNFRGSFVQDSPYIDNFILEDSQKVALDEDTILHMRIDPPFDTRYLRYLWMLKALKTKYKVNVLNDPEGILIHNEKMICYESQESVPTYVGSSSEGVLSFVEYLKSEGESELSPALILKPVDLFQGIGVVKVEEGHTEEEFLKIFDEKRKEFKGSVVVQPYLKEVEQGEIRAIFFAGKELGSILKTPPKGKFLANIAQGAVFEEVELSHEVKAECMRYANELMEIGVPWVAFDILGGKVQEANLTCPGLLVEVSSALGENLAIPIVNGLDEIYK